jgi:hypothetical protein
MTAIQHVVLYLKNSAVFEAVGPINPLNWPEKSEFAIQFYHTSREGERQTADDERYFDSRDEFDQWLDSQEEFVRCTGYALTIQYTLYTWDWGPREVFSCQVN